MYYFFIYFWLALLALFLVLLARQGIQNGCPNRSGEHENGVLAGVIAESHKKEWFLSLFGWFVYLFSIVFLTVLGCWFRCYLKHSSKAVISNPHRKTHGSASKTTLSQNWQHAKKTKKTIKKRFKNMSGKKTWKSHLAGSLFLYFWAPKTEEMRLRTSKKQVLKGT